MEKQKEKSQAKVGEFLLNLQTLRRQIHSEMDFNLPVSRMSSRFSRQSRHTPVSGRSPWQSPKKTPKKVPKKLLIRDEDLMTAPSSVDRLSPNAIEMGCFGNGNPGLGNEVHFTFSLLMTQITLLLFEFLVDEAGHPLISVREAATIVADLRGKLTQTKIQRGYLGEQSHKLKSQDRELEQMALMKEQLRMGRAITNLDLYRALIFKNPRKQSLLHGLNLNITYKKPKTPKSAKKKFKVGNNSSADFSNLRGQAPIMTRKKEIRNIIVPQEDITKFNRYTFFNTRKGTLR